MNRHLEEEAPPLAGLRNDVPPELAAIINRLMAKDPRDRFATPAELAARLAAIIPRLPSGVDVPLTPTLELDADRTLSSGFSSLVLAPPPSGTEERRRRGRVLLLAAVAAAAGIVVCLMAFSFLIAWALATRPGAVRSEPSPAPPPRATRFVLDFDGGPRFVSLPDDLLHASPQLTIEAWFHTRESGGIFGYQVTTYPEVPPHWVPVLYVGGDGSLYGAVWRGQVVPLHGSTPVNDGRWHHAALTSDGHSQSLFQDGERVDSAPGVVHHLTMHRNQIGMARTTAWPQGNEDWFAFTGMIRDVRIWHESRTPEQVRADMTQTPSGSEPSLAAWYPLDESQGERVNDRSQRQRHGRLGGGDRRFQPKRTAVEE